jgi:DNA-binding NarL/FixJ family response regulator
MTRDDANMTEIAAMDTQREDEVRYETRVQAGPDRVRVALLNDYDLVVDGLASMLAPFGDVEVVDRGVGELQIEEPVDVALYDTYGRHSIPWGELRDLVASSATRHVALFTFTLGPELVRRALAEGIDACLWKGMSRGDLADALRRVAKGEQIVSTPGSHGRVPADGYRWPLAELRLTPRESEVLALLAEGMTNRAIAEAMGLGRETVKSHVREVFLKLGVHTRSEATNRVLRDPAFAHQPRHLPPTARRDPEQGSSGAAPSGADQGAPAGT